MKTIVYLAVLFGLLTPSAHLAAERLNVLLICVDDLRPELACFDAPYIHSPNIDRLAARGTIFRRHYVQAPTCGASRYTLLTGRYFPASNNALFLRAERMKADPRAVPPSLPAWFRQHGYRTVSVGKVSHHPGGMGGERWNDPSVLEMPNSWDRHLLPAGPWRDPRGWMHGLAHGEIRDDRRRPGGGIEMDVLQSEQGPDSIYPDGVSIEEGLKQISSLAAQAEPFFLAVGILRPHLPFGAPAKYLAYYDDVTLPPTPHPAKPSGKTTWHRSGEFMKYDRGGKNPNSDADFAIKVRKHYAACVSYADAQVGRLLDQLKNSPAADNTIIVLWGDHGWHLGEHAVWGKHTLFEESLRSPLILVHPRVGQRGGTTNAMVETLDLFPTLCELTGLSVPDFVQGVSLRPQLVDPDAAGHPAIAYHGRARTIRTATHRLVVHHDDFVELYDHTTVAGETVNVAADHAELVAKLAAQLKLRLQE